MSARKNRHCKDFKNFVIEIYLKLRSSGIGHAHKTVTKYFNISYWTLANWIRKISPDKADTFWVRRHRNHQIPPIFYTPERATFANQPRSATSVPAARVEPFSLPLQDDRFAARATRLVNLARSQAPKVFPLCTRLNDGAVAEENFSSAATTPLPMVPVSLDDTVLIRKSHHSVVGKWCWPSTNGNERHLVWFVYKLFPDENLFRRETMAFSLLSRRRKQSEKMVVFPLATGKWHWKDTDQECNGFIFSFVTHLSRKEIYRRVLDNIDFFWLICKNLIVALDELHTCRCIHCDLKPDNILVSVDGSVKIIDFSCSHRLGDFGCTAGTFGYRAPEVAGRSAGMVRVNGRSGFLPSFRWSAQQDVFSVGITLLTLLFGRSLTGDFDSTMEYDGIVRLSTDPLAIIHRLDSFAELVNRWGEPTLQRITAFLFEFIKVNPSERISLRSALLRCESSSY